MITISAFKWVSEFAQGQVRDLRARWALEEAGLPYKARLLEQGDQDKPDYRALQPFGQVPILEEDGLALFESGAIVVHIGERSEMLLPKDATGRARATQWLIAALNSIEPFVMNVALIDLLYANVNGRSCAVRCAPETGLRVRALACVAKAPCMDSARGARGI
jgi:glutathione S-transferase